MLIALLCFAIFLAFGRSLIAQDANDAGAAAEQQAALEDPTEIYTIGVLKTEGATRALESWRPTAEVLNREAELLGLPFQFAIQPHSNASLFQSLENDAIDFILTDPAFFVAAEVQHRARAVLGQAQSWRDRTYNQVGSLIFVRSDSNLRRIDQLGGARLMAVGADDFSGWRLAEQEFRKRRVEPERFLGELVFAEGNQREVVYAVQTGLVDVGVVQAGLLEELDAEGTIDLSNFIAVDAALNPGFPFIASTPLYPEWVLAALPDVHEDVLAHMINVLLNIAPNHPQSIAANGAVWQAPQNYQSVHDLLISLRVRPYENYLMQAAGRIYHTHRWLILSVSGLIILSLLFLVYQLRRNMILVENGKNVLQSEIRSKVFYRSAVEEHTVFCMLRLDGRISHVNESFCETTDRERDGLLGSFLLDLLPENERDVLQDEIMQAMHVGAPWDGPLKFIRNDGEIAWAQCTVIPVSGIGDQLSEIALVATDLTQTQKGISQDTFQDSLELIEDQVVVFRPKSMDILYCNRAAEQLFIRDRSKDDWRGRRVKNFVTPDDYRALQLRCETLQEGPERRMTWEVTSKNGVPYEISLEYVQPKNDAPQFVAMYRDITQRKVAEKAKNEFVATVSHELRTPLTSMKGALGLALSGAIGEMPDQMNKMVTMASNNCDRLVMLINDMLDIEKMEAGSMDFDMGKVDLTQVVENVVEANKLMAEKFKVTLRTHVEEDEEGLMTRGDEDRLGKMLDNLVNNAIKFSDEGGSEVVVSLKVHRDRLRLSIRDFGCGIPKAARGTIFDKFTQADMGDTRTQQGTGLGLSVVKALVEGHDGGIFFATEEGIGSEFFVDLPRMIGDKVIPIEDHEFNSMEVEAFTDVGLRPEQIKKVQEVYEGDSSLQTLVVQLRSGGFDVEVERGTVSVNQVVSGKGVVGQSTVYNWLSDEGRTLVNELNDRGKLNNLDVTVVQAKAIDENLGEALILNGVRANLFTNWLSTLPEFVDQADPHFSLIGVGKSDMPILDAEQVSISVAGDVSQALVLADMEKCDAVLHFDTVGLANCMTVIPCSDGELPASVPMLVIVSQSDAKEAERGVVSKFSSRPGGGGRGKARRKARG